MTVPQTAAGGFRESALPGPYPVGAYAAQLQRRLREFARVQLEGEVWGVRLARARVYFELRDAHGALPCSMWRRRLRGAGDRSSRDGMQVVVGGGCDYYPGSAHLLPVVHVRGLGAADRRRGRSAARARAPAPAAGRRRPVRAAEAAAAARSCRARSASSPASRARPATTCSPGCAAAAGRGGWCGRSRPSRTAAPRRAIAAALRELAAIEEVEVVIVARGGGSLADLFAFCDEALCRTVALLRVPVISSVGHHTDRTLIDDVAAVCCSTPTHAAEAAVPIDCRAAARGLATRAPAALPGHGSRAIVVRARALGHLSRAPRQHVDRHRRQPAPAHSGSCGPSARRACDKGRRAGRRAPAGARTAPRPAAPGSDAASAARELERLALALAAHDPERTLARGYALVQDRAGEPLGSAAAARTARDAATALPRRRRSAHAWTRRNASERAERTYESAVARDRGDHPAAGLRRRRPARDARPRPRGPRAGRVLRRRARRGQPGARGAAARGAGRTLERDAAAASR